MRPHGLRGEVLVFPHSDYESRFRAGQILVTGDGQWLTVASSRPTERGVLVRFAEIVDREASEGLGKVDLFIDDSDRRPLGDDEYWPDELIGLEVRADSGAVIGRITDIDDSSPQTRLLITTATGQHLVPLVAALVPTISIEDGFCVVRAVPGLLD